MFGSLVVRNDHRDDTPRASAVQTLILLGNMDEETRRSHLNKAYLAGVSLGGRFAVEDVNAHLQIAAEIFAYGYRGDFQYMQDMNTALTTNGRLTQAQAKGVLNCLMAEARRKLIAKRTAGGVAAEGRAWEARHGTPSTGSTPVAQDEPPVAAPVDDRPALGDGFYTIEWDQGRHRTYRLVSFRPDEIQKAAERGYPVPADAQHVSLLIGPENGSDYARMAVISGRRIVQLRQGKYVQTYQGKQATEEQLSLAEIGLRILLGGDESYALAAGQAYAMKSGNCYICGRLLTTPESIKAGIGPVCASRD